MLRNFKKNYWDVPFFLKALVLAIPMIVQQTVTNFVSLLDNIMVGQLGTQAMSAVAICNQLIFVYNLTIFGCCSAGGIFGAQFYGKGDVEGHKYSLRFRILLDMIAAIGVMALFCYFKTELISLYLTDTGNTRDIALTLSQAESYMDIMVLTFIPFALSNAYSSAMRETGNTIIPMVSTLTAVFTNILLDYCLIFGPGPFPALGVVGAALATLIARIIEMLIIVLWTHSHTNEFIYTKGLYKGFSIPGSLFKDMFLKGLPLIVNEILWSSGVAFIYQCYSYRGLNVVAASNIASTLNNTFSTVYLQMGVCLSILVGQELGAGNMEQAVSFQKKMSFLSHMICTFIGILLATIGRLFPQVYNTEPEIRMLAASFITVLGLCMLLYSIENSMYFTIRSGGKTLLTFAFDSIYTWLIQLPFTFFLSKHTSLPIVIVYLLSTLIIIPKVSFGQYLVKKGIWINKIV